MNEIRDIHEPFAAWLNKRGIPYHRNRPDKKTTATVGDPDFLITWNGRCLYIECKVPGKTLSPAQGKRVAYLRAAGNAVQVAYSLMMCISAVELWQQERLPEALRGMISVSSIEGGEQAEEVAVRVPSHSSQNLFIGKVGTVDWVLSGSGVPGTGSQMIRRATPADLINIQKYS